MWAPNVRRLVSHSVVAIGMAISTVAARADEASDWWVYVTNDHAHQVEPLLKRGANPNRVTPDGQPTLMQAMRDKAWKVYDAVAADPRTDVNAVNRQGETPLMFLSVLGETTRAQTLIARGAQVNRLGWTPLHYAASRGKLDVVNLLLAQRAIVNAPAPDGTTPLMMAALSRNKPTVDRLLAAGADPTTRNLQGLSAADWARSVKETHLADALEAAGAARDRERRTSGPRGTDPAAREAAPPAAAAPRGGAGGGGGMMFGGGSNGSTSGSGAGGANPEERLGPTSGSRTGTSASGNGGSSGSNAAPGAGSNGGATDGGGRSIGGGVGGVRGLSLGSSDDELPNTP